ncbi:porin (plasmid) [Burkholderia sp. SFA1]|nr:porin [Burkholderia sp. SFA1]
MHKRLGIAAALAGLMHAPAFAQSSVTLYGSIDVGLERTNNGSGTVWAENQGTLVTNRLGFLGKEDLGNGYTLLFQLEQGYFPNTGALDNTNNAIFNRQSWVGVSSDYGTLKLGRIRTLLYQYAFEYVDATGNALAPAMFRLFNFFGNRTSNTIEYSKEWNGLTFQIQHSLGGVAGNIKANSMTAESLAYKKGRLELLVVNHSAYNAVGNDTQRATTFGGNWDFSLFRMYGAYAFNRGTGALSTRDMSIGVRVPIGPAARFMASWVRKSDHSKEEANANMFGVGYTYALSKRTTLYASWAQLANDENASYMVTRPGATWRTFNAGIQHYF